jgi:hypothetical protein
MFLFAKLPSAFFSGVRITHIDEKRCAVTVPYKWFSRNPFRSTYFACLSMAAEMSTGSLAMANLYGRNPTVSMLVIKTEGSYFKKASGITTFLCENGGQLKEAIEMAVSAGTPQSCIAKSVGKNDQGELVAEFFITWSFKVKRSKLPDRQART